MILQGRQPGRSGVKPEQLHEVVLTDLRGQVPEAQLIQSQTETFFGIPLLSREFS
jgi:hypothetical protein